MKPAEQIIRLFKKSNIAAGPKVDKRILGDALGRFENLKKSDSVSAELSIWRIIMKNRMIKFAAAAIVIAAVLIGLEHFGDSIDGSSVAFADVLEYIQTFSYTFDLNSETIIEGRSYDAFTMQAKVLELGQMRVDCSAKVGEISSITDFIAGKTLLLFHENKTAVFKEASVLNKRTGAEGIVAFCSKPIENLWNLRDDTEKQLGEEKIDGQTVTGFRVFKEDQYFQYEITIWADSEDGVPTLVEAICKPQDDSSTVLKWTMKNFDLDVELEEELFSLELPAGYTLAYQSDLDKLEVETEPSGEAEKIEQMFELWSGDRKDEAVEMLLAIDWTEPIEFGKKPYIFSITEKGYISLKAKDQERAMEKIMAMAADSRGIVNKVLNLGQSAVAAREYDEAERCFEAGLQFGKLLARDPDGMIIVRLVGIAVEKKTLNEMISFYTTINDMDKVRAAEQQLRAAEAEGDRIKKKATGR